MFQKSKIINDPLYGLIKIDSGIIQELIDHRFFQRLRRIKQTGLADYVYPGSVHTRFQHSIGAMHLLSLAIDILKSKGQQITAEEEEATKIAILLHDIGHGPFSHCLEGFFTNKQKHEKITLFFMQLLNADFNGKLDMAIKIFKNEYHKKFLHQLISSQLDMDRLDYLKRDSFFTGVVEGNIGIDRIIQMLDVVNDNLVVEAKGIYSIEKFLIARRFMYWQVYYHKTVVAAENLIQTIINKLFLFALDENFYDLKKTTLKLLRNKLDINLWNSENIILFENLDDFEVFSDIKKIKNFCLDKDPIFVSLANMLINRNLPKIYFSNNPFSENYIQNLSSLIKDYYKIENNDVQWFLYQGEISNNTYNGKQENIKFLINNEIKDITEVSDLFNIDVIDKEIKKYYICIPQEIRKIFLG